MAKGDLIRALMGMKHSPAGLKHITSKRFAAAEKKAGKKKKGVTAGMRSHRIDSALKKAGLSDSEIRKLKGSKLE